MRINYVFRTIPVQCPGDTRSFAKFGADAIANN